MSGYTDENGVNYATLEEFRARKIAPPAASTPSTEGSAMTRQDALVKWARLQADPEWVADFLAGKPAACDEKLEIDRAITGANPGTAMYNPAYRSPGMAPHERSEDELRINQWSQP